MPNAYALSYIISQVVPRLSETGQFYFEIETGFIKGDFAHHSILADLQKRIEENTPYALLLISMRTTTGQSHTLKGILAPKKDLPEYRTMTRWPVLSQYDLYDGESPPEGVTLGVPVPTEMKGSAKPKPQPKPTTVPLPDGAGKSREQTRQDLETPNVNIPTAVKGQTTRRQRQSPSGPAEWPRGSNTPGSQRKP